MLCAPGLVVRPSCRAAGGDCGSDIESAVPRYEDSVAVRTTEFYSTGANCFTPLGTAANQIARIQYPVRGPEM